MNKNFLVFLVLCLLLGGAILLGMRQTVPPPAPSATGTHPEAPPPATHDKGVPSVGSIAVLNGCGIHGAADDVAACLRTAGFDVKSIENAPSWNYRDTYVASRTLDQRNASRIARLLHTDRLVLVRTGETMYDVVVIVGADYRERIQ